MSKKIAIICVILVLVVGLSYLGIRWSKTAKTQQSQTPKTTVTQSSTGTTAESLAKCLKEKGDKFYGASWCGHCQNQKKLFGEAVKYLPYVECMDSQNQLIEECQKAGIEAFPTWEINGEKNMGEKTLEKLAELSGCPLK